MVLIKAWFCSRGVSEARLGRDWTPPLIKHTYHIFTEEYCSVCYFSGDTDNYVMKREFLIFASLCICILLSAGSSMLKAQQLFQKLDTIDFYNEKETHIWEKQYCTNHGMFSGKVALFESIYIKYLYDIEQKINPQVNDKCVFLYNSRTNKYLSDIFFDPLSGKFTRDTSHVSELNEISKLYSTHLRNTDSMNSKQAISPLHGSIYCWRER